tara:strand:- start:4487 stop:4675 length:189 start_codon:yes stop_codon:yes gene_type:complete
MRIKLTKDLACNQETCSSGEEHDAVLLSPRSTTVEFILDSGKKMRAFSYEYIIVDTAVVIDK